MKGHSLKYLYKYRKIADAKRLLTERTIRCSHPSAFNDPLDGQVNLRLPPVDADYKECVVQEYLRLIYLDQPPQLLPSVGKLLVTTWRNQAQERARELVEWHVREAVATLDSGTDGWERAAGERLRGMPKSARVLCLSATATSIPMWCHYANQFSGVVVAFDCQSDPETMFSVAQPIRYVNSIPHVCSREEWIRVQTGQQAQPVGVLEQLVFTKSDQWAYEQEWRLLGGKGAPGSFEDLPLMPDEFGGLVIGPRTNKRSAAQLIRLARSWRPTCAIWTAQIDYSAYELQLKKND